MSPYFAVSHFAVSHFAIYLYRDRYRVRVRERERVSSRVTDRVRARVGVWVRENYTTPRNGEVGNGEVGNGEMGNGKVACHPNGLSDYLIGLTDEWTSVKIRVRLGVPYSPLVR